LVIDGGGSAVRARLHGDEVSTVELHESVNVVTVARSTVGERLGRLLDRLPPESGAPAMVLAGLAGAGTPSRTADVTSRLRERYPASLVHVVRDIDLVVSQLDGPGAALIVGTGAVALVPADGAEVLVDGRGFPVGDWGGGAWIGLEALRRGLRHHDRIGTSSLLLRSLCVELGLPTDRGVLSALQEDGVLTAQRVARLVPTVLRLAVEGDEQAGAVVDAAIKALRDTVVWALRRGGIAGEAQVVVAGGLVQQGPFRDRLAHSLATSAAVAQLRFVDPLDAAMPSG